MSRTFKVASPHMAGDDVRAWQRTLNERLRQWGVGRDELLDVDGDYGIVTRAGTSKVLYGLGIPQKSMVHGVTPALRIKVRNGRLSPADTVRFVKRARWRRRLRGPRVASPLTRIIADTWGWHPGVHDGIDLICPQRAPIHSMVEGDVVRADTGGWWGKAPSGDVSKGDGIVIVRCAVNVGPFRKGMNVCYGHAERPRFKVGERVKAGEVIAEAGLAVAWHVHLMVNDNRDTRGVGDRDPEPYYRYARKHG